MMSNNNGQIVNVAKALCKGVAYVGLFKLLTSSFKLNIKIGVPTKTVVSDGYADAVMAILDSAMYASDKEKAVAELKQNADKAYYNAVIGIVQNTNLFASDKINLIKTLSNG